MLEPAVAGKRLSQLAVQVTKRITISLSPRSCPPPPDERALAARCTGSKRSDFLEETVLLFDGEISSDGVGPAVEEEASHEAFVSFIIDLCRGFSLAHTEGICAVQRLAIPSDFEKGWSLLSATLFYLTGVSDVRLKLSSPVRWDSTLVSPSSFPYLRPSTQRCLLADKMLSSRGFYWRVTGAGGTVLQRICQIPYWFVVCALFL